MDAVILRALPFGVHSRVTPKWFERSVHGQGQVQLSIPGKYPNEPYKYLNEPCVKACRGVPTCHLPS